MSSSPGRGRARPGSSSNGSVGCSRPRACRETRRRRPAARRGAETARQGSALRWAARPGADPRPDLQRQGRARSSRPGSTQPSGRRSRARMTVSNFHSFCQRVLTENAADAGLPPHPDVLDGVAQVLLLQGHPRPTRRSSTTRTKWGSATVRRSSSTGRRTSSSRPADFDAFVAEERRVFEARYGSFDDAVRPTRGTGQPRAAPRRSAAPTRGPRERARRGARRGPRVRPARRATKTADREARRTVAGNGPADCRGQFDPDDPRPRSTPSPTPTSSTAPPSRSCA